MPSLGARSSGLHGVDFAWKKSVACLARGAGTPHLNPSAQLALLPFQILSFRSLEVAPTLL